MQVYGLPLSPFVRKVHLVAAEKSLAVEVIPANPRDPSPDFAAASPFRKIPALRDGDFTLADSSAIAAYLEAKQPEPALFPSQPQARGLAVFFDEFADTVLTPSGAKVLFNRFVAPKLLGIPGDEEAARQGEAELPPLFDVLESKAPARGWLAGESFSIGDIAVASVLRTLAYVEQGVKAERWPATAAWFKRVCERPAWQEVAGREAAIVAQMGQR